MHEYVCICMYVHSYIGRYIDTLISICIYAHLHICVAGVNVNTTRMSIFLLPM